MNFLLMIIPLFFHLTSCGMAPFIRAVEEGDVKKMQELLSNKVSKINLTHKNSDLQTLLHVALGQIKVPFFDEETKKSDDIKKAWESSVQRSESTITFLLQTFLAKVEQSKSQALLENQDQSKIVHITAKYEKLVREFLDAYDRDGKTALIMAITKGCPSITKKLLEAGASTDRCNACDGWLPLHLAVYEESSMPGLIALLLKHKADVNAVNKDKQTPLHLAAMFGHVEAAVALLQDPKVHLTAWNGSNNTPTFYALNLEKYGSTQDVKDRGRQVALLIGDVYKKIPIKIEQSKNQLVKNALVGATNYQSSYFQ